MLLGMSDEPYVLRLTSRLAEGLSGLSDDFRHRHAAYLAARQNPDGGYGKAVGDRAGSTYHTFLVVLCYQLLGRDLPDGDKLKAFINSRRREDGGFVEIAPMRRSGTNPTAAAIGVLQILAATPEQFL